jgi:hypothetical protein
MRLCGATSTVEDDRDDRAGAESDDAASYGKRGRRSFSEALLLQAIVEQTLGRG